MIGAAILGNVFGEPVPAHGWDVFGLLVGVPCVLVGVWVAWRSRDISGGGDSADG